MKYGGIVMYKKEQVKKVILYVIFTIYIIFLIKLLFLSRISLFDNQRTLVRSINLIPFHSIMEYTSGKTISLKEFAFSNVVGNILIFVPLGLYLPLLKKDKRLKNNLLIIFIVSLFVEVIQGILGIGASDIDDIILNCLGGLVGILGYKLLLLIVDEKKAITIITILSSIVGLPILLFLLFFIRLRL